MEKILEKIESICVYILITFIVFNGIIEISILDELIVILLLGIGIIKNKNIFFDKKKMILFFIYVCITFITLILRRYYVDAYLVDLIYTLKPFILIEVLISLQIPRYKMQKYINYMTIINTISILFGLYNYYVASTGVFIQGGSYRENEYRLSGFSGHPANIASLSLFTILYYFEEKIILHSKKSKRYILLILLNVIALYLSAARMQMFIGICYIIYRIYMNKKDKIFRILITVLIIVVVFVIIMNINLIFDYYQKDLESAIRFYAISKIPDVLYEYPLLGTGLGTFSTEESIEKNSYVYSKFDFASSKVEVAARMTTSMFESNIAKQLIQTGILGTIVYYAYFLFLYKQIKKKEKDEYLIKFWIIFIIINSILNLAYNIQILVPFALLVSSNLRRKE